MVADGYGGFAGSTSGYNLHPFGVNGTMWRSEWTATFTPLQRPKQFPHRLKHFVRETNVWLTSLRLCASKQADYSPIAQFG
jgi:hypothetical protein